jgi:predicted DNA-binding transcriptional regulator YafY
MKAQRLLAITMLLLGRDSVSAPELAKRFEVSVRTIYRDMDALSEAGIPVVAYPGSGGGFGIMGEFKIDRSLLRPEEIGQLSSTLGSLSQAVGDARMSQVADRLKALGARPQAPKGRAPGKPVAESYLFIELAPAARERAKIATLRRAIEENRLAAFAYIDGDGKASSRRAEPHALVFTWQAWYLYAHCRSRDDFRLFKIARMKELELLPERFAPRPVDLDSRPWNSGWNEASPFLATRIRFTDAARVAEHFAEGDIELEAEGGALVRTKLPADEWAVSFLLGLGLPFEVLEPRELRSLVARRAAGILEGNA